MLNIAIVIPAYNEENRILSTIKTYVRFFDNISFIKYTLIVSLNGCTDNSKKIISNLQYKKDFIQIIESEQAGKGLAIKQGFLHAINQNTYDYIGFVDADMATEPEHFYALINNIKNYDGIIASRYMNGAVITPARPFIKRWGSRIVYEPLIWLLFGMSYKDYQCGAKLFKAHVIKKIVAHLHVKQWAFDVELLYACKKQHFLIKEYPTVWHDRAGSKLKMSHGIFMLGQLVKLRLQHSWLYSILTKKNIP